MQKAYKIFYIVLFTLTLGALMGATNFDNDRSMIFPLFISACLLILLCVSFWKNYHNGYIQTGSNPDSNLDITNNEHECTPAGKLKALQFLIIVFAFTVISYWVSFLVSIPVFVALYTWLSGYRTWQVLIHSAVSFAIYYWVFYDWLNTPLHKGIFL